jgi:biopolymer transport protein TolR
MKRRRLHAPAPVGHINVTPLIDVVMCLIVFYLIVGKLASERRGEVDLPQSAIGSEPAAPSPVVINVLARAPQDVPMPPGGALFMIDNIPLDQASLSRRLAGVGADAEVEIRADRSLSYGQISPVLTACRASGLKSVKLVTRRSEAGR